MTDQELERIAAIDLERTLTFFPRVDNKASTAFAIDVGLLGLMCLNLHFADFVLWYVMVPGAAAVLAIVASLYFVHRTNFPHLKGGSSSLIYFSEVAKRTEAVFIDETAKQTTEARAKDLLGQVWRNSEILKIKFESVKIAFILTSVAIVPWAIFLAATTIVHATTLVIK